MTRTLSNISLSDFRRFLSYIGCKKVCINGGYEKWKKDNCPRCIVFQTHIDPIPKHVVLSSLKTLGLDRGVFELWRSVGKSKK